jgi:hypothetical protein
MTGLDPEKSYGGEGLRDPDKSAGSVLGLMNKGLTLPGIGKLTMVIVSLSFI